MNGLTLIAIPGVGEITAGTDLVEALRTAMQRAGIELASNDVLVLAQKIVSKAEDRFVDLATVRVSSRAEDLASVTGKDARLVQLVLQESSEVLRAKKDVLIVRHTLGLVMANAGIDRSNVGGPDRVLLLPNDPDGAAENLRREFSSNSGADIGVVIADSFGRPWRKGVTNVAIGVAGIPALIDRRGDTDRNGRRLEVTEVAFGDLIASAAGLLMGEGAEGCPAVIVRGLSWSAAPNRAEALLRPLAEDLFR
jgi:coenzyme F420-0:L-glutamate ligase / coenzyme F420-1:gamma-L-glutamate ligase